MIHVCCSVGSRGGCTWTRLLHWWWLVTLLLLLLHCSLHCPSNRLCCCRCPVHVLHSLSTVLHPSAGYRQWCTKDQGQWWHVLFSRSHFCHFLSHTKNQWQCSRCVVFFWERTVLSLVTQRRLIGCIYKVVEEVGIIKLLLTAFASVFWAGPLSISICETSGFTRGCFEIIWVGVSDISDHASDSLQDDTGCFFTLGLPLKYTSTEKLI